MMMVMVVMVVPRRMLVCPLIFSLHLGCGRRQQVDVQRVWLGGAGTAAVTSSVRAENRRDVARVGCIRIRGRDIGGAHFGGRCRL